MPHIWRAEDSFLESVFVFYLMDREAQTEVVKHGSKKFYLVCHLSGTILTFFCMALTYVFKMYNLSESSNKLV